MAEVDSTEPRYETPNGLKNYAEVSDLIAEPLSALVDAVQAGYYAARELSVGLLREFHTAFLAGIVPGIAGRWREEPVQVGNHLPPDHWNIDYLMRVLFDDLRARVHYAGDDPDLQVEALAFTEAKVLHIHPFADFNGRAVRVLALELVRRFDLPVIRSWVELGTPQSSAYKDALVAFDLYGDVGPMKQFWLDNRFG
ncbi:Fic family protein [Mycobacterium helveticum]|uniref:Fic family protein n=1 Tax=Mycobacterium helveticum TaxID=2592811 RepID=A0A557XVI1_9MYCO|nr:Fic family protein [Mycobacterium helveticum]TVS86046.1 Fic family protein [Mycobacterium helveticum]TVS90015.1 Fic family protein [Mycobacterium helveticum]